MDHFATSEEHILAELERIDVLIRTQVWQARHIQQVDEHFQGLYIADEEVDTLLGEPAGLPRWATQPGPIDRLQVNAALERISSRIARRKANSRKQGGTLRLDWLVQAFALSQFEVDILLLCLAPEVDLRYERLFGYLQDDITKKRPSVDLVLNLLCAELSEKLAARSRFLTTAPLLQYQLVHLFDDPSVPQPPLLSKYLRADLRIANYLLGSGSEQIDPRLLPYAQCSAPQMRVEDLLLADEHKRRLVLLARTAADSHTPLIFYLHGPYGVGKRSTAEAICREVGTQLLCVETPALMSSDEEGFESLLQLIECEARLQNAVIFWEGFDALLVDERRTWLKRFLAMVAMQPGISVLGGGVTWEPAGDQRNLPFIRVELRRPTHSARRHLWALALADETPSAPNIDLDAVAAKFRFSGGQIQDAARTAHSLASWRDPQSRQVNADDLNAACRLQSNRKLGELARKVTPHYSWGDIVLPPERMAQLVEIVNHLKYRGRVYEEWGFDGKLAMGKGLNVLFAGPSGTGKTMAADVMAGELGLDLYKIDLSGVVSKYIGETEKNLARIFEEAETSNAILFFDEADALFGKRSEVRDSHDRYANIEISYLLQRMEEYDGMAILATNLNKNLDEAFVRRMHFTVEFTFPNEKNRRRIWEKIWPATTPCSDDLDLEFMARRFEIAGGNIRNIALAAAFLAADDGGVVNMEHLIRATQREYQKMGKLMVDGEFGEYAAVAARGTS